MQLLVYLALSLGNCYMNEADETMGNFQFLTLQFRLSHEALRKIITRNIKLLCRFSLNLAQCCLLLREHCCLNAKFRDIPVLGHRTCHL